MGVCSQLKIICQGRTYTLNPQPWVDCFCSSKNFSSQRSIFSRADCFTSITGVTFSWFLLFISYQWFKLINLMLNQVLQYLKEAGGKKHGLSCLAVCSCYFNMSDTFDKRLISYWIEGLVFSGNQLLKDSDYGWRNLLWASLGINNLIFKNSNSWQNDIQRPEAACCAVQLHVWIVGSWN